MPYLEADRRTYFRHWTARDSLADVVLLHGFGEHGGHYHRFAHALNSAGLDVWGMDLPGHGLSHGERGQFDSVAAIADTAERLVQHVRDRQSSPRPVVAVGHSLGGVTVAVLVARSCAFDAVVMTGAPLSGLPTDVPDEPVMSLDPFYLDALEHDPLAFDTAPAEPALWEELQCASQELHRTLDAVALPTLFVNGERDAFAPPSVADAWAGRLVSAQTHVVTGGYHDIVNDVAHAEVAAVVADFLLGVLGPSSRTTSASAPSPSSQPSIPSPA